MKKPFATLAFLFGILWASALDVTVSQPGTLGQLLGDNVNTTKELTVYGELDDSDFTVLHQATTTGELEELNLAGATFDVTPQMLSCSVLVKNQNSKELSFRRVCAKLEAKHFLAVGIYRR